MKLIALALCQLVIAIVFGLIKRRLSTLAELLKLRKEQQEKANLLKEEEQLEKQQATHRRRFRENNNLLSSRWKPHERSRKQF